MTYKFVTREEIDELESYLGTHLAGQWFDTMRKLFAERDAYREVAINSDICGKAHDSQKVDAEARRLLCGDTARILEGK